MNDTPPRDLPIPAELEEYIKEHAPEFLARAVESAAKRGFAVEYKAVPIQKATDCYDCEYCHRLRYLKCEWHCRIYLTDERGSNDAEWADYKGGTGATLNGGTWGDDYLTLDGSDDYISIPVNAANGFRILLRTEHNANAGSAYLFDCRETATVYAFNGDHNNAVSGCTINACDSSVLFNDVATGKWVELDVAFSSAFTGNIRIGSRYNGAECLPCDIAWITVY